MPLTGSPATNKQLNLILTLANRLEDGTARFLSQVDHLLPVSRNAVRNLSKSDASLCIDHLQAALDVKERADAARAAAPEATAAPEGGIPAADAVALLGKRADLTVTLPSGETRVYEGRVDNISLSSKSGLPCLMVATTASGYPLLAMHRIASWRVVD